jgi:hypothetical protein
LPGVVAAELMRVANQVASMKPPRIGSQFIWMTNWVIAAAAPVQNSTYCMPMNAAMPSSRVM